MSGFSTPAAAVSTFLGLTDTPAAYAAQALRGARVNAGETALEFGAVAYPGPVNPLYESTIIFGPAVGPGAWTDLDVGVGACIALLKVQMTAAAARFCGFRQNGAPAVDENGPVTQINCTAAHKLGYAMVVTDAAGIVEWRTDDPGNITITRLAYWPEPPMPDTIIATGNTPGVSAYNPLDVGVKSAIAFIRVASTGGGMTVGFRRTADTLTVPGGITRSQVGAAESFVACVLTDAEGYVDWIATGLGVNYTMTLIGYILGADFVSQVIFEGDQPVQYTAGFTDQDTPCGRGIAYMSYARNADAGAATYWEARVNGEALTAYTQSGCMSWPGVAASEMAYGLVLLDTEGVYEWWRSTGALNMGMILTIEAISR